MDWVAALPMYNVSHQLADGWRELLNEMGKRLPAQGGGGGLEILAAEETRLDVFWRRRDLLLSQTCGYPLMHGLARHVQVVGAPIFDAQGCDGHFYSSAIVVRKADRASTLEAYRGRVVACNDDGSHSGMNALRHAIAPLALGGRFFRATVRTGSHLNSLRAVCEHRAHIAAIDCVTLAFARDHMPSLTEPLRVIAYTRSAPCLPFIASRGVDRDTLCAIAPALDDVLASRPGLARRLRVRGVAVLSADAYRAVLDMEEEAVHAGYADLA